MHPALPSSAHPGEGRDPGVLLSCRSTKIIHEPHERAGLAAFMRFVRFVVEKAWVPAFAGTSGGLERSWP